EIEIIFGDLNHVDLVGQAVEGVELVFQMAAPVHEGGEAPEIAGRWAQPSENLQLLMAACQAKVRRLIFASSCSVYGRTESFPVSEDDWALPDSGEGFAKLAGELQCIGFTALYGLETARLRYAHVYGPRQRPTCQYAQPV